MLKQLFAYFRGEGDSLSDVMSAANAPELLRHQLREAANSVRDSQKSVAKVAAFQAKEILHSKAIKQKISALELKAVELMKIGRDDLALSTANLIADLEEDQRSVDDAIELFNEKLTSLKLQLDDAEKRLREVKRGQQLMLAEHKARKAQSSIEHNSNSVLKAAEKTLESIEQRQARADRIEHAIRREVQSGECETPVLPSNDTAAGVKILDRLRSNHKTTQNSKKGK